MTEKLDLETAIFRVLSDDDGPSQNELYNRLTKYSESIKKKYDLVLKVDSGNLSRKLKSLENDRIVFHQMKKMEDRDQDAYSYFINKDLVTYEYIIKHIAKNIDTALDSTYLILKDYKKFSKINNGQPRNLDLSTKCALLNALIRSPYVKQLVKTCGFRSIYKVYKEEVKGYCDIEEFIKLVQELIRDGLINNFDDIGLEFKSDADVIKTVIEIMNSYHK